VSTDECQNKLSEQEQLLQNVSRYEEVVLWFEQDLFCQVNLLYLLERLAQQDLGQTRLSLINIGTFPGKENFRGLGELTAAELGSLFPARQTITDRELRLGAAAFRAYCSDDPTVMETLLQSDTSALPFLRMALLAHLKRFPSLKNGLNLIENVALELIAQGSRRFTEVFTKFAAKESVYGLGDTQLWIILKHLATVSVPVITIEGGGNGSLDSEAINTARFELTETGRTVLRGDADFVRLNGIDGWLGGTHLSGRDGLWRWDSQQQKLTFT
jgi:hypothetical protein